MPNSIIIIINEPTLFQNVELFHTEVKTLLKNELLLHNGCYYIMRLHALSFRDHIPGGFPGGDHCSDSVPWSHHGSLDIPRAGLRGGQDRPHSGYYSNRTNEGAVSHCGEGNVTAEIQLLPFAQRKRSWAYCRIR